MGEKLYLVNEQYCKYEDMHDKKSEEFKIQNKEINESVQEGNLRLSKL